MNEAEINQRLNRLEKENRVLRTAGLVCLLLVAVVLLVGAAQSEEPKELTVRKLVVVDDDGKDRIVLSTHRLTGPLLSLYGKSEGVSASLAVWDGLDSAELRLNSGDAHAGLKSQTAGNVVLDLRNGKGNFITITALNETIGILLAEQGEFGYLGSSSLRLQDSEGFISSLGTTSLKTAETGETSETSAASLTMFHKDGKVIWRAP